MDCGPDIPQSSKSGKRSTAFKTVKERVRGKGNNEERRKNEKEEEKKKIRLYVLAVCTTTDTFLAEPPSCLISFPKSHGLRFPLDNDVAVRTRKKVE